MPERPRTKPYEADRPALLIMPVQIGAPRESGFDDPLGMLQDCHRRIERFLNVLCRLAERPVATVLTPEEQDSARAALEYFRGGGARHTQDEEESLFPRLEQRGAELAAVHALEGEHREAEALHAEIERLFGEWFATEQLAAGRRSALQAAARRLQALYAAHIQVEETVVFPRAAAALDAAAIRAIGAEFQARRR